MNPKNVCSFCGMPMNDPHGNRVRHEECGIEFHKSQSIMAYEKKSLKANPFWLNEKILRELYYTYRGSSEIDPQMMEDSGFDFELHNSITERNGHKVFVMNHFGFSFSKNKKITLWKI